MHYRDEPHARYQRDPQFKQLVDMLEHLVHTYQFSPSELREAAVLASIRYESVTVRPRVMDRSGKIVYVNSQGVARFEL